MVGGFEASDLRCMVDGQLSERNAMLTRRANDPLQALEVIRVIEGEVGRPRFADQDVAVGLHHEDRGVIGTDNSSRRHRFRVAGAVSKGEAFFVRPSTGAGQRWHARVPYAGRGQWSAW